MVSEQKVTFIYLTPTLSYQGEGAGISPSPVGEGVRG